MPNSPRAMMCIGATFWVVLATVIAAAFGRQESTERSRASAALSDIARLATEGSPRHAILYPGAYPWIEAGDGIYRREGFELLRCGQVLSVADVPEGRRLECFFDPAIRAELKSDAKLTAISSGASISWTWRSLFPEHVRERVTEEWNVFAAANELRLTTVVLPLAKDLLRELGPIVLDEMGAAFERHRAEFDAIASRYRDDILKPRILPLLRGEIWPLCVEHGGPALRALGRELWQELPIVTLAWKGVAQEFDFSDDDLVEKRFDHYLSDDALPILQAHSQELETALLEILRRAADDPEIETTVKESLSQLLADRDLRALLLTVVDEVVRGERVKGLVLRRLDDPTVTQAIADLRKELDGVFQRIGRKIVFANETTYEVHPEFARFLRTLVLKKDRRWILFEPGEGALLPPEIPLSGVIVPE